MGGKPRRKPGHSREFTVYRSYSDRGETVRVCRHVLWCAKSLLQLGAEIPLHPGVNTYRLERVRPGETTNMMDVFTVVRRNGSPFAGYVILTGIGTRNIFACSTGFERVIGWRMKPGEVRFARLVKVGD